MDSKKSFLQRKLGMQALGEFAPKISVVLGSGSAADADFVYHSPFKRSEPLIAVAAVFFAAFCIPLFTIGDFISAGDGGLFSLVFTLFTLFWVLGWSTGVALLLLGLLCLLLGREKLVARPDGLVIEIGIPGIALAVSYRGELVRNFRYTVEGSLESSKWRGEHIVFDYSSAEIGFGSSLSAQQAAEIIQRLRERYGSSAEASAAIDQQVQAAQKLRAGKEKSDKPRVDMQGIRSTPITWYSVSGLALIGANLIPLFGVLLAAWDIGEIMLLFWAESAIIGYYNLCKMRKVGGWSVLFYGPFFVGHYGAFMVVHLLFIYALFGGEIAGGSDVPTVQVLNDLLALWPALLGLLISHGISYYKNFVLSERHRERSMGTQMQEPYRRIIIMHMTLIFGGFLAQVLGSGVGALLLLLGMKIAADLKAHLSQHSP